MNAKTKQVLALCALTLAHFLATTYCFFWMWGYVLARAHGRSTPTLDALFPFVRVAGNVTEFPLVHLARLVPYVPGSSWGGAVALLYLSAYLANSVLWAMLLYGAATHLRHRFGHRGRI